MKLELKHIQHYPTGLTNGLMLKYDLGNGITFGYGLMSGLLHDGVYISRVEKWFYLNQVKPILRPMSDLYIEIDGKIGIVELAKIAFPDFDFSLDRGLAVYGKFEFSYNVYRHYFACSSLGELRIVPNQLDLFKYLFENHYDVYDLIEQGLAIDKNTIQY